MLYAQITEQCLVQLRLGPLPFPVSPWPNLWYKQQPAKLPCKSSYNADDANNYTILTHDSIMANESKSGTQEGHRSISKPSVHDRCMLTERDGVRSVVLDGAAKENCFFLKYLVCPHVRTAT